MFDSSTLHRVKSLVCKYCSPLCEPDLHANTPIARLHLTDKQISELLYDIEEEFDHILEDSEFDGCTTLSDLCELLG